MACHFGLVHFLKRALAKLVKRSMSSEQHYGRFGHFRYVQRRQSVRESGACRDHCYANLACQAGPSVGHVYCGGLLPDVY